MIDTQHHVTHWNKALQEHTGIKAEQILGTDQQWRAFYKHRRPCMADLVLDGKTEEIAGRYPNQQRSMLVRDAFEALEFFPDIRGGSWLFFSAAPVYDGDGTVIGAAETLLDVTERELAIESLRQSEERYRTLIEKSNDGITILHGNKHVYVSRRFAEIVGYERPEDVVGKHLEQIVHPEDCQLVKEFVDRGQRGEPAPERHEFRCMKADGSVVYLEASAARVGYHGECRTLAFLRDITERKRNEEEKERLRSRLLQAEKMEAVGTLAGGIAHDFNNILTVLIGYAEQIKKRLSVSDPLRLYAERILSASRKAMVLTQGLLTFSRHRPITLVPLNLNEVVQETEDLLRRLLTEDIALRIDLGSDGRSILGDQVQIDQILLNLVSNARDAMPNGGLLTISTKAVFYDEKAAHLNGVASKGHYMVITVTDSGCGMEKKILEKVFQPFFTTKEVGKGTGLGLSTVYGIVKQHSGGILIESEPGKGTAFKISFPAVLTKSHRPAARRTYSTDGTETVLVAEDDQAVRHFIKEILEHSGYTVIEAADGEEAVTIFKKHSKIDMIFMDTVMPRKNGKEAFDIISRFSPSVKVLFSSGYAGEILADKGFLANDFAFIAKPVSATELLSKIREVLDGKTAC